ncbi:MAG: serine hydrolase domain-containing protein [Woeseiaceae bacterium]|nr:serine hydrolase domain-containing protein [Woeseiaceae bacterium]
MRKSIPSIFVLFCAVTVSLVPHPLLAADRDLEERVDTYLRPYLEIGHLSGTVLLAKGEEILYQKSFGLADQELNVMNTPNTRFGVGSVNKPMTIVILARLIEEGKVSLSDTLAQYAPDFPRGENITVEHLLNHSSGIAHRVTSELDETRPQTAASLLALAAKSELVFEPGSDTVYSSAGFSVLARVLEIASGEPYSQLLEQHVLDPAEMAETSDAGSREIIQHRAKAYFFDTAGLVNAPPGDISYLVGAGSVFSTPADLFAMQRALIAGKFGKLASEALVRDDGGLSWNGSAAGYRTLADYDAESDISLIMATNLTSGAIDRIRKAVPLIAAGADVPVPAAINAAPYEVEASILEGYQGLYQLRPGRNLQLRVIDGRVTMDDWLLIPVAPATFFSPQDYAEITVVQRDDGLVERLDWKIGDDVYTLPRIEP